jgi:hypothetical protein
MIDTSVGRFAEASVQSCLLLGRLRLSILHERLPGLIRSETGRKLFRKI